MATLTLAAGSGGRAHADFLRESPASLGSLYATNLVTPKPVYHLGRGLADHVEESERYDSAHYLDAGYKFDLTSIPAGSRVTAATIDFSIGYGFARYSAEVFIGVHGSSDSVLTLDDFLGGGGNSFGGAGGFAFVGPTDPSRAVSLDMTGLVDSLAGTRFPYLTLILGTLDAYVYVGGASLSVTFTPAAVAEPSSLALCAIAGLMGLAVARVRRERGA